MILQRQRMTVDAVRMLRLQISLDSRGESLWHVWMTFA
jgi:hypothetical protein